ncbi:MAG: GGDEF domain-containing protein [Betaproteobacteria bacterium]|nr:GGDEF domain-containing protein [Betaproteobacteria bacterium]
MDTLLDFLQLSDEETLALRQHAPALLERAGHARDSFAEQARALRGRGELLAPLGDEALQDLLELHDAHYRELLAPHYTPVLQQRMLETGQLFHRWGLAPLWIMTMSSGFAAQFEMYASSLSLQQRRPLMGALYKRLRRDEAWQLEGYRQAGDNVRRTLERSPLRDPLTELLNATALREMLPQALERSRRSGMKLAVAVLDFDGFGEVNEQHGRAAGDAVLRQFAQRLLRALRKTDLVVRSDEDEFVLVLECLHGMDNIAPLLERLQLDFDVPYALSDAMFWQCPISMGVTLFPEDDAESEDLLLHARCAMQQVKATKSQREFFWGFYQP